MWAPRWNLDVAGHYARPDVFQLTVRKGAHPVITVDEGLAAGAENEPHVQLHHALR